MTEDAMIVVTITTNHGDTLLGTMIGGTHVKEVGSGVVIAAEVLALREDEMTVRTDMEAIVKGMTMSVDDNIRTLQIETAMIVIDMKTGGTGTTRTTGKYHDWTD